MFWTGYAGYEIRKWLRDAMSVFMLSYFMLMAAVGRWLVPALERQLGMGLDPYYHAILAALMLLVARINGSVAGFSILDDRDDNILLAVKVAPMSLEQFIGLKLGLTYIISLLGGVFVLWFSDLVPLRAGVLWGIPALSAIAAPITAMLINCVASNKIEGFAALKGFNGLIIFPIVALFVAGLTEFVFAVEPGFWPAKALSIAVTGGHGASYQLGYAAYMWIGWAYGIVANLAVYQLFKRRV